MRRGEIESAAGMFAKQPCVMRMPLTCEGSRPSALQPALGLGECEAAVDE